MCLCGQLGRAVPAAITEVGDEGPGPRAWGRKARIQDVPPERLPLPAPSPTGDPADGSVPTGDPSPGTPQRPGNGRLVFCGSTSGILPDSECSALMREVPRSSPPQRLVTSPRAWPPARSTEERAEPMVLWMDR